MLSNLYHVIFFQPLLNLLVLLYELLWKDIGLSIIVLTVIVRLILYPSFKHQLESQKKLAAIQPKLNEIKEKHKDNREAMTKATMDFYKENKMNPFSSCLPTIIQILILLALYRVLNVGLHNQTQEFLYGFVPDPGKINPMMFGFFDLSKTGNYYLAAVTGVIQYIQGKMMVSMQPQSKPAQTKDSGDFAQTFNSAFSKQFLYLMPLITFWIGVQLPAGLSLYWLVSTLFAIWQQYLIMKGKPVLKKA